MKRRQNGILGTSLSVGMAGTLGVGGWIAFRIYVRQRLLEELQKEGLSETFQTAAGVAGFFKMDLNIPPPIDLAKSMVPIWSLVMPEEALRDISINGRGSIYWPEAYSAPSALAAWGLEKRAFRELGEAIPT